MKFTSGAVVLRWKPSPCVHRRVHDQSALWAWGLVFGRCGRQGSAVLRPDGLAYRVEAIPRQQ